MNSRRLTFLLVRTAVFFVLALIAAGYFSWSPLSELAVALTGGATAIQLGGVLWLRRTERNSAQ